MAGLQLSSCPIFASSVCLLVQWTTGPNTQHREMLCHLEHALVHVNTRSYRPTITDLSPNRLCARKCRFKHTQKSVPLFKRLGSKSAYLDWSLFGTRVVKNVFCILSLINYESCVFFSAPLPPATPSLVAAPPLPPGPPVPPRPLLSPSHAPPSFLCSPLPLSRRDPVSG